jgi:chromatin segregation and condensation protein Rec8/ScpA/Scc1 (kleisin family)
MYSVLSLTSPIGSSGAEPVTAVPGEELLAQASRLAEEPEAGQVETMLASLTVRFLADLRSRGEGDLEMIGEFLRVTSTLVLMRSHALLSRSDPDVVEEASVPKHARAVDAIAVHATARFLAEVQGIASFAAPAREHLVERPFESRPATALARAWVDMQSRSGLAVRRVTAPAFVRLEAAVSGLIRTLKTNSRISFRSVLRGASRNDAVMHFMAVLELVRRREIAADQTALFEDITIFRVECETETDARVG